MIQINCAEQSDFISKWRKISRLQAAFRIADRTLLSGSPQGLKGWQSGKAAARGKDMKQAKKIPDAVIRYSSRKSFGLRQLPARRTLP